MKRLGYDRFVAQGGDWGALITDLIGVAGASGTARRSIPTWPRAIPPEIDAAAVPTGTAAGRPRRGGTVRLRPRQSSSTRRGSATRSEMGNTAADALRARGFAGRPRRVDHRPRHLDATGRSRACSTASRMGLTRDDILDNITLVLADEDGRIIGAALLGEQERLFRSERCQDPRRGQRLPGGNLPDSEEVGGSGLSQPDLLSEASRRCAFRGVGAAEGAYGRSARRLPNVALA